MGHDYWVIFIELIRKPFEHVEGIWGIVPLYFALLMNEMTPSKANHRTALQTGFSFLWAGAHWVYPNFKPQRVGVPRIELGAMLPVNLLVTSLVIGIGAVAFISGVRRKFPKHCSFLGHTRFSNYFMIALFPLQARYLEWTWERLIAITLFALPIWLLLHFGLMPIRHRN